MISPASVTFVESPWLWAAGGALLLALILLVWSYRQAPTSGAAARLAFGLKLVGIAALAACLIEPLWSGRHVRPGANLFAVLADNSGGMSIRDTDADRSRGETLRELLRPDDADWLAAISENFQVRQYAFDSRLQRMSDFNDLTFDGTATAMYRALQTLGRRHEGRPLAGVLLLTDGCATDLTESAGELSDLPPVYPVLIGDHVRPPKDLALSNVTVTQTSFEDAPVTIQAQVQATGLAGRTASVDLQDASGEIVERRTWEIDKNEQERTVRFRLRPDRTGVLFYRLRVSQVSDEASPAAREATLANNSRTVVVHRGRGPHRVLYVSGRPNWEYKFLRRAMETDEQVELVGLLRVARREPKYDFRGRAGETSNPLYRGFDRQEPEETEQYDQPVMVRLNTRDAVELREGFPKTPEDLFGYRAVILDDIEAEFFSHDQMDLLRRFVAERGGGFLMLGGRESFQGGGFQNTPIGNLLPVYLDPVDGRSASGGVQLTREGWLQPWVRLRDTEDAERQRLSEMPGFRVFNRLPTTKPGARVMIATDQAEDEPLPALVVQQFGNGRVGALATGDLWRWGMQRPESREDMEKFWRQTLRWLIADVPDQVSLLAKHDTDQPNQAVALQVRVHDEAFEPVDDVSVAVEVHEPDGEKLTLRTVPAANESGLYEATYVPRTSGGYLAKAIITGAPEGIPDAPESGWATDLEAVEFQSVRSNPALLENIAQQTGGRMVKMSELSDFGRGLAHSEAPISDVQVRPLWDLPGVLPALFLLALTCLGAEWTLRRWKGLP